MPEHTTIQLKSSTKKKLDKIGEKGQSYNDIVEMILKNKRAQKTRDRRIVCRDCKETTILVRYKKSEECGKCGSTNVIRLDKKGWQYDLEVCPDCNTIQQGEKREGDRCDKGECDSIVDLYNGKLIWHNENWG